MTDDSTKVHYVGKHEKQVVSDLNRELFDKAREVLDDDDNMVYWHMGWKGVSVFINWLEENYELVEKVKNK